MSGFFVAAWFTCGIFSAVLGINLDRNAGRIPRSGNVWLAFAGPIAFLAAIIVCIERATEKSKESQ